MITHQEKIIQNVCKQLDGMHKIEVYDVLLKIESMLRDFKSPIRYKEIEKSIQNTSIKSNVSAIDSFGYCHLFDECQYIKIYKIKTLLPNFLGGEPMYFITPWQFTLKDYTNDNLLEAFKGTHVEAIVEHFLKANKLEKYNPKTKRLLLLEVLDHIDPG